METLQETLDWKYSTEVENSYIIAIKGHEKSEEMAKRCLESCQSVGQKASFWDAFDGTGDRIIVPAHSRNKSWLSWLKLVNYKLTRPEVCCLLSHFSLWCRCIEVDAPIVVLEHDAVMLAKYTHHNCFNSLVYLGSSEMVSSNYWNPIPPHAQLGHNYRYMLRTHAYSVDPIMAKNLVAHTISRGIYTAVDVMMKIQEFSIVCFGIFAADMAGKTTINENDSPLKV